MRTTLELIKNEFPNQAIDILECLQLLNEVINSTMKEISNNVSKSFNERDFPRGNLMMKLAEDTSKYEREIDEIIEFLDVEDGQTIVDDYIEENISTVKDKPNYEAYQVDSKMEHTLYENLTNIRPYGFKFPGGELIEVKTWKQMFSNTCEILIVLDKKKFLSFEHNPKMNGKKRKYFSRTKEGMTAPKSILDLVFIETNLSSNGIRNVIVKMLKEFKINPKELKIYFLADYTDLNK